MTELFDTEKHIYNNKNSYHLKFSFQLNPPQVMSEAVTYSNVSSDITSITGQTTVFLKFKEKLCLNKNKTQNYLS